MAHHRRSIRLKGYDYRQTGAYFVTICAYGRACLFGKIIDGVVHLSPLGCLVRDEWEQTAVLRDNVELDAFVIMPNHFHGILVITGLDAPAANARPPVGAKFTSVRAQCIAPVQTDGGASEHTAKPPPTSTRGVTPTKVLAGSLGAIVRSFKAAVTRQANRLPGVSSTTIWQRNYHEHIIRNEADLDRIRNYIEGNPSRWNEDSLYSAE